MNKGVSLAALDPPQFCTGGVRNGRKKLKTMGDIGQH
jgi:hypothetical protein